MSHNKEKLAMIQSRNAEIVEMWKSGFYSTRELSEITLLSKPAIYKILKQNGIATGDKRYRDNAVRQLFHEGHSLSHLSDRFGVTRDHIRKRIIKKPDSEKAESVCPVCGEYFRAIRLNQECCSAKCSNNKPRYERTCPTCGKYYRTIRNSQVYCCVACSIHIPIELLERDLECRRLRLSGKSVEAISSQIGITVAVVQKAIWPSGMRAEILEAIEIMRKLGKRPWLSVYGKLDLRKAKRILDKYRTRFDNNIDQLFETH